MFRLKDVTWVLLLHFLCLMSHVSSYLKPFLFGPFHFLSSQSEFLPHLQLASHDLSNSKTSLYFLQRLTSRLRFWQLNKLPSYIKLIVYWAEFFSEEFTFNLENVHDITCFQWKQPISATSFVVVSHEYLGHGKRPRSTWSMITWMWPESVWPNPN